jgi:Tfp pilus assembly protein PilF
MTWHDRFRGRMGEPFALEDAIARGIEGKLRARLAPGGGRRAEQIATTPEVYALYSEARQLNASRERANFRRAEALLRQAVKADPNYAPAWSLLGAAIYFNGRIAIVDANARAEGMAAVKRALAMAPNFAPAHATLALIEGEGAPEAEARLRRAVTLDPNYSEAWNWLGNSLVFQARYREAEAAYERAVALDPLFPPAVGNLTIMAAELKDDAAIERLLAKVRRAGASPELVNSIIAEWAHSSGDYSSALRLLSEHGLDANGRPKRLLWLNWFEGLTATGHYDALHRVTGCPDWYAPLLKGQRLPPKVFVGKPVTPEEFWTSLFFSAPASRAMVNRGQSRELVSLYRAGFNNADAFISETTQQDMLPSLAVNVAMAMKGQGLDEEAAYLLNAAATQQEQVLKRFASRKATGRLALVRAAQGERAQALALLETALRRGWLPDGHTVALDLAIEPAFAGFRSDPQFEASRRRILDHIAKERAELGPLRV